MNKLKKFWLKLTRGQKPQRKYMPCILPAEMHKRKSEYEIIEIYEPAFREPEVIIPLAESKPISFPLSDEDVAKLKSNLRDVWCDGYESAKWMIRDCKYLGIRITDSFILHETVIYTWEDCYHLWVKRCRARLLRREEIMLLDFVWNEVSAMREKAWDVPLPKDYRFWIQKDCPRGEWGRDQVNRQGDILRRDTETFARLLMAVTND